MTLVVPRLELGMCDQHGGRVMEVGAKTAGDARLPLGERIPQHHYMRLDRDTLTTLKNTVATQPRRFRIAARPRVSIVEDDLRCRVAGCAT
jgi:hypothetical protein